MKIYITKRLLVKHILGTIYEMAPGNRPRNIDKIHNYILDFCKNYIKDYKTEIESNKLYDYIKDILKDCNEFDQLNISQKLWDEGVRNSNDERNSGFAIAGAGHDSNGEVCSLLTIKEYSDFIDLGALIRNISISIINEKQLSEDCFLCKFAGKYGNMDPTNCKECNTCFINPNYTFNRIPHPKSLLPRNSEEYINYKE